MSGKEKSVPCSMKADEFLAYLAAHHQMTETEKTLVAHILDYARAFISNQSAHQFLSDILIGALDITADEIELFTIDRS